MKTTRKLKNICALLLLAVAMLLPAGCGKEALADVYDLARLEQGWVEVACVSSDRYVHQTLSEKQQRVYDEMLDAIMNMKENVRLSTTDRADVKKCYNAICADYGEIFWVDHCAYREITLFGSPVALSFDVTYAYSPEEVAAYRAQMQPSYEPPL